MSHTERFLGIDVSKQTLDVAVRPDGTTARYANTPDGIVGCVAALTSYGPLRERPPDRLPVHGTSQLTGQREAAVSPSEGVERAFLDSPHGSPRGG